jgi:hypothetical protein
MGDGCWRTRGCQPPDTFEGPALRQAGGLPCLRWGDEPRALMTPWWSSISSQRSPRARPRPPLLAPTSPGRLREWTTLPPPSESRKGHGHDRYCCCCSALGGTGRCLLPIDPPACPHVVQHSAGRRLLVAGAAEVAARTCLCPGGPAQAAPDRRLARRRRRRGRSERASSAGQHQQGDGRGAEKGIQHGHESARLAGELPEVLCRATSRISQQEGLLQPPPLVRPDEQQGRAERALSPSGRSKARLTVA